MIPETSETHTEGFPYEIFRHRETDIFWRKIVILPPPLPPLIHKFFRYQKFSETKKGSPTKYFRYCETTIFFIENCDFPLLGIKFFDIRNFLRHRRFPRRNFSNCETKYFRRKIVILLCIRFFDTPIFWNFEAMSANFFGSVRPSLFDGKTWYPLLCIKFFDTPSFLEHWRDAHEIFWHCETKNFRLKIVILPLPFPPPSYP